MFDRTWIWKRVDYWKIILLNMADESIKKKKKFFFRVTVESIVYWRDPKKSGVVFGSIMVVLLSLTTFSLISVVAYGCLTVLVAALSFRIYKSVMSAVQKTSEGHPFK